MFEIYDSTCLAVLLRATLGISLNGNQAQYFLRHLCQSISEKKNKSTQSFTNTHTEKHWLVSMRMQYINC